MAFTGAPIVKKVTNNLFRITGVSLAADASGTIGFSDKDVPSEVSLVAPNWQPYARPGGPSGDVVELADAVDVEVIIAGVAVSGKVPLSVSKTGSDHSEFEITITNRTAGPGVATDALEIYVQFGGH